MAILAAVETWPVIGLMIRRRMVLVRIVGRF
jgi:hypothetical protein